MINTIALYLGYPNNKISDAQKAFASFKEIVKRAAPSAKIIVIDNSAIETYQRQISDSEYEISGDNQSSEFSGWQRGISFVRQQGFPCDVFIFGNDRFLHRSAVERKLFDTSCLETAHHNSAIVGVPISLPVTGEILGHCILPYFRTHLFVAARPIIDSLLSIVTLDGALEKRFFIDSFDARKLLFCDDAPISQSLRSFLFSHVTKDWYQRRPYELESFPLLRRKLTSILNAILLSVRIRSLGFPLVEYGKVNFSTTNKIPHRNLERFWLTKGTPIINETGSSLWDIAGKNYVAVGEKQKSWTWDRIGLFKKRDYLDHL